MLHLHGGLPKTSTTSLQHALAEHQDRLAAAGVLYPAEWRTIGGSESKAGSNHYGLQEMMEAWPASRDAFDDLRRFLSSRADMDVLLSSEHLALWFSPDERREALLALCSAAQEVTPTRVIWTLRRVDEVFEALYRRRLELGKRPPPPSELIRNTGRPSPQFAGMQCVEEVVDDTVYVKYESSGAHNLELLGVFGIPGIVRADIERTLEYGPRHNVSPSHKQIVALANTEALSERAGVELSRTALQKAFGDDGFEFEQDGPCILLSDQLRKRMHENALVSADGQGFTPYVEFFADARLESARPVSLEPDVIAPADLQRLVEHLHPAQALEGEPSA